MTGMTLFQFHDHQVRTVQHQGEPWFIATDIAAALTLSNAPKALAMVDPEDKVHLRRSDTITFGDSIDARAQSVNLINESGVYAMVFRSNKPEAVHFKRWVTSEVLPTLRKTGLVISPDADRFSDEHLRTELLRQLQMREYKDVRDALRTLGEQPSWQYGEVHNVVLVAITGMKAAAILAPLPGPIALTTTAALADGEDL